jgi:hypothetical protein
VIIREATSHVMKAIVLVLLGLLAAVSAEAAPMPFEDRNDNGVYDEGIDRALTPADIEGIVALGMWSSFDHSLVVPAGATIATRHNGVGLRIYAKRNIVVHGSLLVTGRYGEELTLDTDTGRIEIGPAAVLKGGGGMYIATREAGMTVAGGAQITSGEAFHLSSLGDLELLPNAQGRGPALKARSGFLFDVAGRFTATGITMANAHPRGVNWISLQQPARITNSTFTLKNGMELFARDGLDFTNNRVISSARATIDVFVHLGQLDYTGSLFRPSEYPHLVLTDVTGVLND